MHATLTLRAVDSKAAPSRARFYVTDVAGEAVFPEDGPHLAMRNDRLWASERHFVADGPVDVRVRPGRVSVGVERGPEFVSQAVELELRAGEHREIELEIPRRIDMKSRGWFSGDLHVHRAPDEMRRLVMAEELNVGTCIATQWRDDPVPSPGLWPSQIDGWLSVVDATHAFSQLDAEVERLGDGPGAVVAVGLRRALSFDCERWYPPDSTFADLAHAAGGHVDAEKLIWDDVPVLAALGKLDSVGVVCNHFARTGTDLELEPWGGRLPPDRRIPDSEALARWIGTLYARLLNCGFRLPVSGGSASAVTPNPVGYNRTYVRVDGGFSYAAWLNALRRGRSFATNGPMLTLTADDHQIGDEVPIAADDRIQVRVRAESLVSVYRMELLVNGEVVADAQGADGESVTVLEHELTVREPGWIAARAFAGTEPNIRFAHTSPIYLSGEGAPRGRAADARLLGEWVGSTTTRATDASKEWPTERRNAVLEPLRRAGAVYRKLSQSTSQPRAGT